LISPYRPAKAAPAIALKDNEAHHGSGHGGVAIIASPPSRIQHQLLGDTGLPSTARLLEQLMQSTKATVPVLDPGACAPGAQLWGLCRRRAAVGGPDSPAVAYVYACDRKHTWPAEHLFAGGRRCLQDALILIVVFFDTFR
jgi:hypothetical protein